jgi:hypothetical protein
MKLKVLGFLFLLCSVFFCTDSYGQKNAAAVDFKKMNEAYEKHADLSVDVTYNFYDDYAIQTPSEAKKGFYKKHNQSHLTRTANMEMLQNPGFFIIKDEKTKVILAKDPVMNLKPKMTLIALDSMLTFCKSIKLVETKTQKIYKLHYEHLGLLEFEDIDIIMNKKNYFIERMVFYYKNPMKRGNNKLEKGKKPRLETLFTNYSVEPIPGQLFSEKNYVKIHNGKIEAVEQFDKYTILDQRVYTRK